MDHTPEHPQSWAPSNANAQPKLWQELLGVLRGYGEVFEVEQGFTFRQHHETAIRHFRTSPSIIYTTLRNELSHPEYSSQEPELDQLPDWFLDDILEFVGSVEEPYDHDVVHLDARGPRPVTPPSA